MTRNRLEGYWMKYDRICDYCGEKITKRDRHGSHNKHHYCSKSCSDAAKVKKVLVECDLCGRPFMKKSSDIHRTEHNFCSQDCALSFRVLTNEPRRNRRINNQTVHRTIAEAKAGRKLSALEEVHHIDGNPTNNNPDNLVVLTASEHSKIHAAQKGRDQYGRFVKSK